MWIQRIHSKVYDIRTWTCKCDLCIRVSPLQYRRVYQLTWNTNRSKVTSVISMGLGPMSWKKGHRFMLFFQIRQRYVYTYRRNIWYRLPNCFNGVTDKPRTGKYKEITDHLNYDASCTLASLPVSDLIFSSWSLLHNVCKLFL